jgi:hypothetical protein
LLVEGYGRDIVIQVTGRETELLCNGCRRGYETEEEQQRHKTMSKVSFILNHLLKIDYYSCSKCTNTHIIRSPLAEESTGVVLGPAIEALENDTELREKYISKLVENAVKELTRVDAEFNRMRMQEERKRERQEQ